MKHKLHQLDESGRAFIRTWVKLYMLPEDYEDLRVAVAQHGHSPTSYLKQVCENAINQTLSSFRALDPEARAAAVEAAEKKSRGAASGIDPEERAKIKELRAQARAELQARIAALRAESLARLEAHLATSPAPSAPSNPKPRRDNRAINEE